jgi:hypothetical protein
MNLEYDIIKLEQEISMNECKIHNLLTEIFNTTKAIEEIRYERNKLSRYLDEVKQSDKA